MLAGIPHVDQGVKVGDVELQRAAVDHDTDQRGALGGSNLGQRVEQRLLVARQRNRGPVLALGLKRLGEGVWGAAGGGWRKDG